MSNFQPGPVQDGVVALKSGLKIRCLRRDPSKFFTDVQTWFESLDLQKIENWTVTADPSGHLTLIVAYRENKSVDPTLTLLNDTIGLVCDLAEQVKTLSDVVSKLLPSQRPPANSSSELTGAAGSAR